MPKSSRSGKQAIIDWITQLTDIKTVLDVGAGKGTYKRLCDGFIVYKDIQPLSPIFTDAEWTAVEVWEPYIKEYELEYLYDKVINSDARLVQKSLDNYDLAFAGDVLEHMTKDDAIRLVKTLSKKCKILIISIPLGYHPQGEHNSNPFEVHIKDDWTHQEFISTFPDIKKFSVDDDIGVYWIQS
jgi:hypothetical protein